MPSPFQTPSGRRKVVYLGLILGLFVVNTFFWRGVASPLTGGQAPSWTVQAQATKLELTEETQGDPDLVGSIIRLVLTGSRGAAVTFLWQEAIEKQKRNEWSELEFIVRSLTKLQPHFLTPWLFQSWNLSYNVSVEADRVKDKYFYISRGIELLAQGERVNKDNPDMRYWIAFYYQNKFGVSDENNSLRSLFQLSCIPPKQRDPEDLAPKDLQTGRRKVDLKKFEEFCRQHPQLVRRLREPPKELSRPFRCNTPDEVVEFLADNRRLPTRFVDSAEEQGKLLAGKPGDLKSADQQFPVLPVVKPVRYNPNDPEPTAADNLDDTFGPFTAARAWFAYAQDPLPDPDPLSDTIDRKERIKMLKDRRLPRQPAEVLFRQSPCRAQSYIGEYLHKEGWFDDSGWSVDGDRAGLGRWFPRGQDVVVGAGKDLATDAWSRAARMWFEFGVQNGMLFRSPAEQINLEAMAVKFQNEFKINRDDQAFPFRPEALPPEMRKNLEAHKRLALMGTNRNMTNFMHHYIKANAEQDRETAQARKTIDRAETFRRAAEPERAIEAFEKGFDQWKAVLVRHPDFRKDWSTQEDLYESEVHYLDLIQDHRGEQLRPALTFQGLMTAAAAAAAGAGSPAQAAAGLMYRLVTDGRALPLPVLGPLDGTDTAGQPWISADAIGTVRQRLHQEAPIQQKPPPDAPARQTPARRTPGG
jgi:hypothetical protein